MGLYSVVTLRDDLLKEVERLVKKVASIKLLLSQQGFQSQYLFAQTFSYIDDETWH